MPQTARSNSDHLHGAAMTAINAHTDVKTLRVQARKQIEESAVTAGYSADRIAERIALDSYREMIQYLGDQDPTTSQMLKGLPVRAGR